MNSKAVVLQSRVPVFSRIHCYPRTPCRTPSPVAIPRRTATFVAGRPSVGERRTGRCSATVVRHLHRVRAHRRGLAPSMRCRGRSCQQRCGPPVNGVVGRAAALRIDASSRSRHRHAFERTTRRPQPAGYGVPNHTVKRTCLRHAANRER